MWTTAGGQPIVEVDDAAATTSLHDRGRVNREKKGALRVGVKPTRPVGTARAQRLYINPGHVDEDVESPERSRHAAHRGLDVGFVGRVSMDHYGGHVHSSCRHRGCLGRGTGRAISQRESAAPRCKPVRNSLPNPRAARAQRYLTLRIQRSVLARLYSAVCRFRLPKCGPLPLVAKTLSNTRFSVSRVLARISIFQVYY